MVFCLSWFQVQSDRLSMCPSSYGVQKGHRKDSLSSCLTQSHCFHLGLCWAFPVLPLLRSGALDPTFLFRVSVNLSFKVLIQESKFTAAEFLKSSFPLLPKCYCSSVRTSLSDTVQCSGNHLRVHRIHLE